MAFLLPFCILLLGLLFTLFSFHRLRLLFLARRARRCGPPSPPPRAGRGDFRPFVTIQIPLYNEPAVAERALRAAAALAWPRDLLEIQVLDDSTDATRGIVDRTIDELTAAPPPPAILLFRRSARAGFKAGALSEGLRAAHGELIAIFEADFIPPADFLERAVPHFQDADLAMLQARWGYLNEKENLLTRAQASALSAHFGVEQRARAHHEFAFNFNGTAGLWRASAIRAAGGWSDATLTEDLELSYRVLLNGGGKFLCLDDLRVPSELPPTFRAFRAQQTRWIQGMTQCAVRILPRILRSGRPLAWRWEAALHLLAPLTYPMTLLSFLFAPFLLSHAAGLSSLPRAAFGVLLWAATFVFFLYHVLGEMRRNDGTTLPEAFLHAGLLLIAGVGISPFATAAVVRGLLGTATPFVRTPKWGDTSRSDTSRSGATEGRGNPFSSFAGVPFGATLLAGTAYALVAEARSS